MKLYNNLIPLFEEIEAIMKENETEIYEYEERHLFHFGLGVWLRNEKLTEDRWRLLFEGYGIEKKDDQSSLIFQFYYLWQKEKGF